MKETVQRETLFSQKLTVNTTNDYKVVWCWRKAARGKDWNISKSVTPANGEITVELSEAEASQLPFEAGWFSIYEIDASTGKKTHEQTVDVDVVEGTAGSDYSSTSTLQTAVPYSFQLEGVAEVTDMQGLFIPSADGYITRISCGCQDAPLGSGIVFSIQKNDVEIGTITLSAGETRNYATASLAVAQDDIIDVAISSVGCLETGVGAWCQLDYQAS